MKYTHRRSAKEGWGEALVGSVEVVHHEVVEVLLVQQHIAAGIVQVDEGLQILQAYQTTLSHTELY